MTNPRMFDLRVYRLWENLNVLLAGLPDPTLVVFEDVLFSVSTAQTQLWASLRAAVWLSDAQFFDCVPVPTLKKFATQHGNATKQLMGRCAKRCGWDSWSRSEPDDNEVDAVFALLFAEDKYGKAS